MQPNIPSSSQQIPFNNFSRFRNPFQSYPNTTFNSPTTIYSFLTTLSRNIDMLFTRNNLILDSMLRISDTVNPIDNDTVSEEIIQLYVSNNDLINHLTSIYANVLLTTSAQLHEWPHVRQHTVHQQDTTPPIQPQVQQSQQQPSASLEQSFLNILNDLLSIQRMGASQSPTQEQPQQPDSLTLRIFTYNLPSTSSASSATSSASTATTSASSASSASSTTTTSQETQTPPTNQQEPIVINNADMSTVLFETIENPLNTSCPISHKEFTANSTVIILTRCKHIFYPEELVNWLDRHNTCPCCRSVIPSFQERSAAANTNTTSTQTSISSLLNNAARYNYGYMNTPYRYPPFNHYNPSIQHFSYIPMPLVNTLPTREQSQTSETENTYLNERDIQYFR